MILRPNSLFNPKQVSWGGPNERVTEACSYCDAPLSDDDFPLILWNNAGWCARFCDACQAKYWGMTSFEDHDRTDG